MRLSLLFLLLLAGVFARSQSLDTLVLSSGQEYAGTLRQNIGKVSDTLRFRPADEKRALRFDVGTIRELRLANGQRLRAVAAFPGQTTLLSTYLVSGEVSLLRSDKLPVLIDGESKEYVLSKNNFRLRLPDLLPLSAELTNRLENSDFRITDIESILIDHYQATGQRYETYPWQRNFTLHFFAGGGVMNSIIETAVATGSFSFQDGDVSSAKYLEGGLKVRFPPLLYATLGLRYTELAGRILANLPTSSLFEPLYFRSDLRTLMLPLGINFTYTRTKLRPVIGGEMSLGKRIGGAFYREFSRNIRRDFKTSDTFFGIRLKAGLAYEFDSKLVVSLLYVYDDHRAVVLKEGFSTFLSKSRGFGLFISY